MRFDEITIGRKETLTHTITPADLEAFVKLTGDTNPLHVNPDFAARTSFEKPVVHGMLCASFISTLIGTRLPGEGALWVSQKTDFLLPVRMGATLTVSGTVIRKVESQKVIVLKIEITNEKNEKVIEGESTVKCLDVGVTDEPVKKNTATGALPKAHGDRLQALRRVFSEVFGVSADSINDELSPDNLENWDSLRHMQLVMALEETFSVSFTGEEVMEMLSFKLVREILQTKT